MVTDKEGRLYEHLEYTAYGELWVDRAVSAASSKGTPFRFSGKELDAETGLYYYGARYLDPKTSRWLSADPAMYQGDYLPGAPVNEEAKKRNGNLPGQGGVFNVVNMHVYHYAGNNPIKYVDPTGEDFYNNGENTYIVIPEHDKDKAVIVHPGEKYEGPIDGAMQAREKDDGTYEPDPNGKIIKITGKEPMSPDVVVKKGSDGEDVAYMPGAVNDIGDLVKGLNNIRRKKQGKAPDLPSGVYNPGSDGHNALMKGWGGSANNNTREGAEPMGPWDKEFGRFNSVRIRDRK